MRRGGVLELLAGQGSNNSVLDFPNQYNCVIGIIALCYGLRERKSFLEWSGIWLLGILAVIKTCPHPKMTMDHIPGTTSSIWPPAQAEGAAAGGKCGSFSDIVPMILLATTSVEDVKGQAYPQACSLGLRSFCTSFCGV